MKLSKLRHDPNALVQFFRGGLERAGAVCERTWHDRLEVLAEGEAATVWGKEKESAEVELYFPPTDSASPRQADREVFPGCPLTFRMAEVLQSVESRYGRACLDLGEKAKAPARETAEKQWEAQMGRRIAGRPSGSYTRDWHCSLLVLARCDIQAIDQHWSLHRMVISLPDGRVDEELTANLTLYALKDPVPAEIPWSRWTGKGLNDLIRNALREEIQGDLGVIQARQKRYLERELRRVDQYFRDYTRELEQRKGRQHRQNSQTRYQERIDAAKAEHERRRQDQVQRHEIHVYPHVDALVFLAEPAWKTEVTSPRQEGKQIARYVPRNRRWIVE